MNEARGDATHAGVTAAALDQGRAIDLWGLALLLATFGVLLWKPGGQSEWSFGCVAVGLLAGAVQRFFAARVAFDAALFKDWAARLDSLCDSGDPTEPLAATDQALAALGLRKSDDGPPRDLASRSRGALRLLGWQVFCLAVQLVALLAAAR